MKMSSLKNEFDMFDKDFGLEENIINEDLDIDPDNITRMVMKSISADSSKRKSRRNFMVFLVAAVICTAIVCTSVIAGTGVVKPDFSQVYSGDVSVLDVRGTEAFRFEALDQNLQAEFLGMVNTEDKLTASVNLTKKDDTVFTRADGIQNPAAYLPDKSFYHNNTDTEKLMQQLKEHQLETDYPYVILTEDNNGQLVEQPDNTVQYILSDDGKTLKMFITVNCADERIRDGKITVSSRYTKAYSFDKKLRAFNTLNETTYADAKYFCQMDGYNMDSDCKWKISGGQYALYTIDQKRMALPFDMSFRINYQKPKYIRTKLTDQNAPQIVKKGCQADLTIYPAKLTVTTDRTYTFDEIHQLQQQSKDFNSNQYFSDDNPFITDLSCISSFVDADTDSDHHGYDDIDYDESGLLMTDGTVLNFLLTESNIDYAVTKDHRVRVTEQKTLTYSPHFINEKVNSIRPDEILHIFRTTILNPDNIAKILINNNTVYSLSGYEAATLPQNRNTDVPAAELFDVSDLPSSPDQDYTPDMTKYQPSEKTANEICYMLNQYSEEHSLILSSISTSVNSNAGNSSFRINQTDFTVNGSKDALHRFLIHLMKEEEHNLFIVSAALSDNQNDEGQYQMIVTLENPYLSSTAYMLEEDIYSYILSHWGSVKRNTLINAFFEDQLTASLTYLTLNDYEADFSQDQTSPADQSDYNNLHKPNHPAAVADYQYKKWTEKELRRLNRNLTGSTDCTIENIADADNNLFRIQQLTISFKGTQQKIASLLKRLLEKECNNLFITEVNISERDRNSDKFVAEVTVSNPYPIDEAYTKKPSDYILHHYGSVDWEQVILAYFKALENISVSGQFVIGAEPESDNPVVIAHIQVNLTSYADVVDYKDTVIRNSYFSVTNNMNIKKIHPGNHTDDYLLASMVLISDRFLK